jgi:hypothetical protein
MTKFISAFALVVALVATIAAADQGAGVGVGSGDANAGAGAGANAGGKAGTETGAGKGTEGAQPGAKAATGKDVAAEVKLDTLPANVKSAVTKEASAQEISSIHQRTENGRMLYDVEVSRGGKTETICFDDQGKRVDRADAGAARQQ